jgi:hydroxyacylglutathione hydrolase
LEDTSTKEVVVVDPTEASLVTLFVSNNNFKLNKFGSHTGIVTILNVQGLLADQNISVYGPREELSKMSFVSNPLQNDDHFYFNDLKVEIIATPGHTLGHIVYFIEEIDTLFSGDTLFAMGCGLYLKVQPSKCITH